MKKNLFALAFVIILFSCSGLYAQVKGKGNVDANNTLLADRPIQACPVPQAAAKKGVKPDAELVKKIIRCIKGEHPASKGYDGAVTVDVTAVQFGTPRKWLITRDIGGGPGITIYPVKATYTVKTFYRTRTLVEDNWIRTINFFVNEFGEWTTGSEEPVKICDNREIPVS